MSVGRLGNTTVSEYDARGQVVRTTGAAVAGFTLSLALGEFAGSFSLLPDVSQIIASRNGVSNLWRRLAGSLTQ